MDKLFQELVILADPLVVELFKSEFMGGFLAGEFLEEGAQLGVRESEAHFMIELYGGFLAFHGFDEDIGIGEVQLVHIGDEVFADFEIGHLFDVHFGGMFEPQVFNNNNMTQFHIFQFFEEFLLTGEVGGFPQVAVEGHGFFFAVNGEIQDLVEFGYSHVIAPQ